MPQYLLSIYQPDGGTPEPDVLDRVMAELNTLNEEIRAAGGWVFAGGLQPPAMATVVKAADEDFLTTDGPYIEGKEHIGGFTIVEAPDLDVVLDWACRMARATTLPIEVRPFQGG